MTRSLTLDQLAERSAAIVASWPPGKLERTQLQGTDAFQERMRLRSELASDGHTVQSAVVAEATDHVVSAD